MSHWNVAKHGAMYSCFITKRLKWPSCSKKIEILICSKSRYSVYFLIPLTLCLLIVAYPIAHLELALGQYTSQTPTAIFSRIAPIAAGASIWCYNNYYYLINIYSFVTGCVNWFIQHCACLLATFIKKVNRSCL
jgi:hypothetical protein